MKVIKTKLIQKSKGRKQGKYEITLNVNDKDIEMFEDLATTFAPFQYYNDNKERFFFMDRGEELDKMEFTEKYKKWLLKTWRCFCELWGDYDK